MNRADKPHYTCDHRERQRSYQDRIDTRFLCRTIFPPSFSCQGEDAGVRRRHIISTYAFTPATFVDVARHQAYEQPERLAYTFFIDGEEQAAYLTYAELDLQARIIGGLLQAEGQAGERVLLLYPPGLDYITAFLGCLYAGMIAVPAYAPSPAHLERRDRTLSKRLFAIIEDAQPALGLTTPTYLNRINTVKQSIPEIQSVRWFTEDSFPSYSADLWREPQSKAETLAALQYTSGSTGTPRGVMLTHGNLLHNSASIQRSFGHTRETQGVSWLPPYHDMGLIGGLLQPLYVGFPVVLISPVAFLQKPVRWLHAISRYHATSSGGPDFAYNLCVNKITEEQKASLDLQSWQVAFNGAEPIRPQTLERFALAFAPCGFRYEAFHPCYGLAEATLLVSNCKRGVAPTVQAFVADALEQNEAVPGESSSQKSVRTYVSCGEIPPEECLRIVHPQTLSICQEGQIGEIWVSGTHIGQGYWQREEETQTTFNARLKSEPNRRFLRTGDLGFLLKQQLFVTGRIKDLIIIRGQNHYPQDIEQTVEQSHRILRVNATAAFVLGEESAQEQLVVVQELERHYQREDLVLVTEAIRQAVAAQHDLQVHTVVLVKSGSIPRTSSGKIQRHSCQVLFQTAGLEVIYSDTLNRPLQESANPELRLGPLNLLGLEPEVQQEQLIEQLTRVVARSLKVEPTSLGRHQSLSTLGLDSLMLIEINHRIEADWGVTFPFADFWRDMHIEKIAETIIDALRQRQSASVDVEEQQGTSANSQTGKDLFPLSYGQRGLYFLHHAAPTSNAYQIVIPLRITSAVDVAALRRAFEQLTLRHSSLRSTFQIQGNAPVQHIHPQAMLYFRHEEGIECAEELAQRVAEEAKRPIDLANGPILRVFLFSQHAQEHVLLLVTHHIAVDFWSLVILAQDLGAMYTDEKRGQAATFSTPSSYHEFVDWQQKKLNSMEGERLWKYWQGQLTDAPTLLNLPTNFSRPPVQTYRGATYHYAIDQQLTQQLKEQARALQVTPFMLLLAAFYVVLYRYTAQEDILVGSPVAGRSAQAFAGLVGYITNTVVLRGDLRGNPSFLALLYQIKQTVLEALAHQDYPFTLLVERLQPERDPARSPLIQVMFILQKAQLFDEKLALFALEQRGYTLELGGLTVEPLVPPQQIAQFDVTLLMAEVEGSFLATWQYNTDLFESSTIEQLNRHFQMVLREVVHNPTQKIGSIPILNQSDLDLLLRQGNSTDYNSPTSPPNFLHSFETQATSRPDAPAVVFGTRQFSYAQLNHRANQFARYLQQRGVQPETFVGIYLSQSLEMIVALLAILKAQSTIVSFDPTYPQERLLAMLSDARPTCIVTNEELLHTALLAQVEQVICIDQLEDAIDQQSGENLNAREAEQRLAYLIYTSGSTGQPKGSMLPLRSFNNMIAWQTAHANLKPGEKTLQYTSLNFDVSFQEIFPTLASGGILVMISEVQRMDPVLLLQLINASEIQRIYIPPAILQYLAETAEQLSLFPGKLHTVIVAGDQLKITRQIRHFFQTLSGCRLDNQYGPSETHVATAFTLHGEPQSWLSLPPIGRAISHVQLYLLDRHMQPVPRGAVGEVYIGGAGLGRGYLNKPDLTAEKFFPNPFSDEPGTRLYRTGDLAHYLSDGNIAFLGRSDYQVKIRGVRIELGEIETKLNQYPSVRESLAVVKQQKNGEKFLVAYVVPEAGQTPTVEQLRLFLQTSLTDQMLPSTFVFLESLPLNINGKIDRAALPMPDMVRPRLASSYALPQTAIEQEIAAIWRDILQLEAPGIHDNFFDSGGHSLLIMQLQRKLYQVLGYDIPIVDLFKYPTISALAAHISTLEGHTQAPRAKQVPGAKSEPRTRLRSQEIAVIGMAGRFPGSSNLLEFWQHLSAGDELITFFSEEDLKEGGVPEYLRNNPNYVKAGAILENADLFAASFFGFNAREAEMMDPQQRIFLECAWDALEDAAYDPERYAGSIGVFAGAAMNTYLFFNLAKRMDLIDEVGQYQTMLGNDKDFLATRVSYKLNLKGPSITVQTACSTSLVAVHMACRSLLDDECDIALAGGVALRFPQKAGYLYQDGGILSPDGHCRAFSSEAQGTVPGSGVGVVVLKPLEKAIADGDQIYAVIKGSAINNDGSLKAGYTAPSVEGQAKAIISAFADAGIEPETISYVETHGTGTRLGDPIEIAALTEAYRQSTQAKAFCRIGSLKTNIGHADTAAGIASLLKVLLALRYELIPPSLHYKEANPQIDFTTSPFYVNTVLTPWRPPGQLPRRAGISSLGIGGTNAHLLVEQAPVLPATAAPWPWQILPLSAKTSAELETLLTNFQVYFERQTEAEESNIADIAYTLQVGRREFPHRCFLLCQDRVSDACQVVETRRADRLFFASGKPGRKAVVFLFPGQGTQYVNMTRELYATIDFFRRQVDYCAELLLPYLGADIRTILYPEQDTDAHTKAAGEQLGQTFLTQPALFVVEYALAALLRRWHIEPQAMIGHSIGEYVAACIAGVFSLEDALQLVTVRGRLIQQLPQGSMLSVPLSEQEARTLLEEHPALSLAAINSPRLCTISGPDKAIALLEQPLLARQIPYRRLHTSHAFHSAMMDSILAAFHAEVCKIALQSPQIMYISNITGTWITSEQATDPSYWVQHLRHTVRFAEGIVELQKQPDRIFLEVGPGHSLSAFVRQYMQKQVLSFTTLPHPQDKQAELAVLLGSLGKLWLTGFTIDWEAFWEGSKRRRVSLPTYPFTRQSYLVLPNQQQSGEEPFPRQEKKEPDIKKWFYLSTWHQAQVLVPAHGNSLPLIQDGSLWLIFSNECSIIDRISERLQHVGQEVLFIKASSRFEYFEPGVYTINPGRVEDYEALLQAIALSGKTVQHVIHAWTITDTHVATDFATMQELGYYSLLYFAQAWEKAKPVSSITAAHPLAIAVISNALYALTELEPLDPHKATLLGPCKVIPQEYPGIAYRCFDIVPPQVGSHQEAVLSEHLLTEMTVESADPLVAFRGRQRWIQSIERLTLANGSASGITLRQQGVYLITGGLGSLGSAIAMHLALEYQANLILLGRTVIPLREEWQRWLATHDAQDSISSKIRQIQCLEQCGSRVLVISANVADKQQMFRAMQQVDQHFGILHGIIHTAGVTSGDSIYQPMTGTNRELSEEQFQAKAYGLIVLEEVLQGRKLDFCLLFGSNAATLGGLGFTAYASANLFMNAFARAHNMQGMTPWLCINWDVWEQTTRKKELQQYSAFHGGIEHYSMTTEEGIQAFDHALALLMLNEVIVSPSDFAVRLDLWVKHKQRFSAPEEQQRALPAYVRPALQSDYVEPRHEVERSMAKIWERLLGVAPIGIYDNFFELGGHSLLATQLTTQVQETFGIKLPLQCLFETPTVADLAAYVLQQLANLVDEELLNRIEQLT